MHGTMSLKTSIILLFHEPQHEIEMDVQSQTPAALPLEITRYTLYRRLEGHQKPIWD